MPGTIIFKPIEANLQTKDKDLIGKMDPYCLFHVGLHRVKGQVCKSGGTHPVWTDEIPLDIKNESIITVDVKDKDMLIDDKIGTFEVDLREIESKGQVKKWYPIFHKNQPMGEILLEAFCPGGGFKQQGLPHQGLSQGVYQPGLNQGSYQQSYPQQSLHQGVYNQGLSQQGLHQGSYQQSFPQQNLNQGLYQGSNLPGSNLSYPQQSHLPTGGILPTSQMTAPHNFAEEALLRGVDPTNLQQKLAYNSAQTQGLGSQQLGSMSGQNLTQTSNLSSLRGSEAEMIYEGDVNRFNHPPHQMPFGHGHHTKQDPLNPLNPNQNLSGNNPQQF